MSIYEFPVLYGTEKNGKEKVWKAVITQEKDKSVCTITYGQIDGKQQVCTREYTTGKNIGKTNETTPYQQCFNETERKWKDKQKENYTQKNQETVTILPMLAKTYTFDSKHITYPCMVQPKLDGLRCIMYMKDGVVYTQSRTGGFFELSYLKESLRDLFLKYPDLILDGELYTNEIPFETLAGLIKKKKMTNEDRSTLQQYVKYHIYDLISDEPFHSRHQRLQTISWNPYICPVQTVTVKTKEECKSYFSLFVEQGYEGIMLRNCHGKYTKGYRSNDLQKYKEFFENEYPITGYEEGEGRDKGCVIWICQTGEKEFRVRPRGTMESRRLLFQNGHQYIGKQLTVIYQELSEQNIPRFPVGKDVRDGY